MHWILQNNIFNEAKYDELVETLTRFEIPFSMHKVVPFVGELDPVPMLDTKEVICIGSYSMRHAAKKYGWSPGVWDLEPFNFVLQLDAWHENMLNFDSRITKFKDAVFTEDYQFVRPIDDSKHFAGKVFDKFEFIDFQKRIVESGEDWGYTLTPDTLVQVCTTKEIYREVRFWVVNGKVVTASVYKIGDRVTYYPNIDESIQKFAEEMISIWSPLKAFVIDIAETPDGYKVVEINTINSSGFYAADIQKLVSALDGCK